MILRRRTQESALTKSHVSALEFSRIGCFNNFLAQCCAALGFFRVVGPVPIKSEKNGSSYLERAADGPCGLARRRCVIE